MSAWIASDKHIASVVCAVYRENEHRERIANAIKTANIRSVNYRYNERTKITPCDLNQAEPLHASDVVKLAHSLDYQCCERPDWNTSKARQYVIEAAFRASLEICPEHARWSM